MIHVSVTRALYSSKFSLDRPRNHHSQLSLVLNSIFVAFFLQTGRTGLIGDGRSRLLGVPPIGAPAYRGVPPIGGPTHRSSRPSGVPPIGIKAESAD